MERKYAQQEVNYLTSSAVIAALFCFAAGSIIGFALMALIGG